MSRITLHRLIRSANLSDADKKKALSALCRIAQTKESKYMQSQQEGVRIDSFVWSTTKEQYSFWNKINVAIHMMYPTFSHYQSVMDYNDSFYKIRC